MILKQIAVPITPEAELLACLREGLARKARAEEVVSRNFQFVDLSDISLAESAPLPEIAIVEGAKLRVELAGEDAVRVNGTDPANSCVEAAEASEQIYESDSASGSRHPASVRSGIR
jgi:hypothetical protein